MHPKIIVFGDTELGAGTITDDFIADVELSKVIRKYSKTKETIDMVFNGDTFDYLKCPVIINKHSSYPRHITSKISLHKTKLIFSAHHEVISAMRDFAKNNNHQIYFLYGNHDPDIKFPEVQSLFYKELKSKKNIHFQTRYERPGLHIEHGDAYDVLHQVQHDDHFITYRGNKILNLPYVSYGLMDKFMVIKEIHPFLERIKPESELFRHHKEIAKIITSKSASYFMKSIFYYPLRHFKDPTYTLPKGLFEEFIHRARAAGFYVGSVIPLFKSKNHDKLLNHDHQNVYILGHRHDYVIDSVGKNTIMHPDTWRDEYILDPKTKLLKPKDKHYIELQKKGHDWKYKVHTVKSIRPSFDFNYVTKNEVEAANIAAAEEGYVPPRNHIRHKPTSTKGRFRSYRENRAKKKAASQKNKLK